MEVEVTSVEKRGALPSGTAEQQKHKTCRVYVLLLLVYYSYITRLASS